MVLEALVMVLVISVIADGVRGVCDSISSVSNSISGISNINHFFKEAAYTATF